MTYWLSKILPLALLPLGLSLLLLRSACLFPVLLVHFLQTTFSKLIHLLK